MSPILIIYGTTEGHTAKIASRLAETISAKGYEVDVFDSRQMPGDISLGSYAAALIGASMHAKGFQQSVREFVQQHHAALKRMPSAFFSVSLTEAYPPGEHLPERAALQEHIERFLDDTDWEPQAIASFAGALSYSRYGFFKRRVMRSIARKAGQPTDTSRDYEYTDWEAVARFAEQFAAGLEEAPAASTSIAE